MARVDNTGGSGFTVDNGTGLVVRTKLNQVIAALSTLNQGSGEMSVGVAAYVPHIDGNTLKIRNAANNAFVSLGDVSLANLGHASLSVANTFTARATFSVTSSITLPSGTTAQRDGSPAVGMIRHNSETNTFEGYNNGAWGSLSGASGISNVVDDTSPQLGGNLDVLTREINTSTTNGNIKVAPNGTGLFEIKGNTNDGTLQLNCNQNSHGVKIKSPAHSAGQSYTLILPDNQIAADKILKVKSITGSGATAVGQLEYATVSGGITMADQWRITSNVATSNSISYLTSGWERVDGSGQGTLPVSTDTSNLMEENGGIFTFPSTGIYLVEWQGYFEDTGSSATITTQVHVTTDNNTYNRRATSINHISDISSYTYGFVSTQTLVDVTNTTNVKVKLAVSSEGSVALDSSSTENRNCATFIRLGDT